MYSEIIVFMFCVFATGGGVAAKYQDEANTITEEDRRAATLNTETKTELRPSETKTFHRFYFPSAHGSSGIGSSEHGAYGHNTGYPHIAPQYYIPPAPVPAYHSGHSYGEIDGGHGGNYDGLEYGGGYGFSHGGEHAAHGVSTGHKEGSHKALALKAILIPLAGIALLGAAAALSTNPVLLQLGVLNGRRRRRDIRRVYPTNPFVKPARA